MFGLWGGNDNDVGNTTEKGKEEELDETSISMEQIKKEEVSNKRSRFSLAKGLSFAGHVGEGIKGFGDKLGTLDGDDAKDAAAEALRELDLARQKVVDEANYFRRYLTNILLNSLNPSIWVNIQTLPPFWIRLASVIGKLSVFCFAIKITVSVPYVARNVYIYHHLTVLWDKEFSAGVITI